jgi:teichuronic acid biosynthesis glycosyltransferase TuaG
VIAAYNEETNLARALRSVFDQTRPADEVIVVDDGSADRTAEVAHSFDQARYMRQENLGQAAARNLGISVASGRLIAFLDADDEWMPDKLARQTYYMDEVGAQISYTDTYYVTPNIRTRFSRIATPYSGQILRNLLSASFITTNTVMIERQLLIQQGGFGDGGPNRLNEDFVLWLRLAQTGLDFHYIDEPLAVYHAERNPTREYKIRMEDSLVQILEDYLRNDGVDVESATIARRTISRISARNALRLLADHQWLSAMKSGIRASRYGDLEVLRGAVVSSLKSFRHPMRTSG